MRSSSFQMALREMVVEWDANFEQRYSSELELVNQNGETLEEVELMAVRQYHVNALPSELFLIVQRPRNRALMSLHRGSSLVYQDAQNMVCYDRYNICRKVQIIFMDRRSPRGNLLTQRYGNHSAVLRLYRRPCSWE
jgi:hypothetical protein